MLRKLSVRNFFSIYETVEVSLLLNGRVTEDYRTIQTSDDKLASKLMVFVGANGSGKTNILKSLAFLQWFIAHSFAGQQPDSKIPLVNHFLGEKEPSEFHVEFEYLGHIWRYDLVLTKNRVLHEALYRKKIRFVYLFKRDWQADSASYEIRLKDEFDFSPKEAQKVRQNTSLIATAAQYNQGLALKLTKMNMMSNLTEIGKYNFSSFDQVLGAAEFFFGNAQIRQRMQDLLRRWDLGLTDVAIKKKEQANNKGEAQTLFVPYGIHQIGKQSFELLMLNESSGTQSAFALLSKLLPILEYGGLAVIDEIEADLHPHMLAELIDLFISPETNPHQAQLVFSTHSTELLNKLRKEQIVLVEKNSELSTDAYRLDELDGVRVDDNFYAKYMAGAYGAVPEI